MLAQFVHEAAPGEAAAIARDVQVLSGSNHAAATALRSELLKHNTEALRVVSLKGHKTVLSKYNARGDNKFWSRGREFQVDHEGIVSEERGSDALDAKGEELLSELETYATTHYSDAVVDIFPFEGSYVAVIKGERLSPRNFFNGAWTAQYTLGSSLQGSIKVDVHYYEDGNVRLKAGETVKAAKPSISAIADAETKFQQDLTTQLAQLNQNEFKLLRRQLPVTRSQMVWSKATAGYKIGAELQKN